LQQIFNFLQQIYKLCSTAKDKRWKRNGQIGQSTVCLYKETIEKCVLCEPASTQITTHYNWGLQKSISEHTTH